MPDHQLRVRIDNKHRAKLLEISSGRKKGETLSDMVREAIEAFLKPQPPVVDLDFVISEESQSQVRKLAQHLERQPHQVIEDCVDGVIDMFEQQKQPLIVLELELRAKYFAQRGVTDKASRTTRLSCGSGEPPRMT